MIHALSSIYLLIIHSVFHGVSWLVGCSACQTDSRTSQTIVFFSTVIRSFFVIMCVPPSGLFCVLFSERKGRSMNISLHLVLLFFLMTIVIRAPRPRPTRHFISSPPSPHHLSNGCDFVQTCFVQRAILISTHFLFCSILYRVEKIPWCSYGNYRQVKLTSI